MLSELTTTIPVWAALAITVAFLLALAKLYPAKLYLVQIKFNYTKGTTLMQFKKVPNILARIFFYSTPTIVRYIGNNRQWHTFHQMKPWKKITSKRMIQFLWNEETREHVIYKRRTVKKARA